MSLGNGEMVRGTGVREDVILALNEEVVVKEKNSPLVWEVLI